MRNIRLDSPSEYYHVMKRGAGKQMLFEDRSDYIFFLKQLEKCRGKHGLEIGAFCLMNNHIHLLIKASSAKELSRFMQSLGTGYAMYFNAKYSHVGPVFQGRYKGEPIDDFNYFLTCIRYIHNNPEKAGIAKRENYEWSSYPYYVGDDVVVPELKVETKDVLDILGGVAEFVGFSQARDDAMDESLRDDDDKWVNKSVVERANKVIREYCGCDFENNFTVKQLAKNDRDEVVRLLKREGIRPRQIELITGISRDIVRRIK